jgi:hypothetical protein
MFFPVFPLFAPVWGAIGAGFSLFRTKAVPHNTFVMKKMQVLYVIEKKSRKFA